MEGAHLVGGARTTDHNSRFHTKKTLINMNVIQCYAPTNDGDVDEKDNSNNRFPTKQDGPKKNIIV
ncbi:hypothetical protein DPMN_191571 [Dreissena polymorpha]|uniref:Uncharacterized protein n=1 Tax=Dreissena polymorpha TaxID=45954 RepID=A0A9D3Y420_DREPO|nr:hypothetical protein DPMN_191571 [Dreissena polymorpha]